MPERGARRAAPSSARSGGYSKQPRDRRSPIIEYSKTGASMAIDRGDAGAGRFVAMADAMADNRNAALDDGFDGGAP